MAAVSKTAVSRVIASSHQEDGSGGEGESKKSRDEFKKQKELEEQRKLGNAPAAVDEEGKDINPHIPQYISDAPWYLDPKGPTLKHQRQQDEKIKKYSTIDEWYKKGVDTGKIATKYRKGACENCGAITHKKRDCLERPRKIGAKYTGSNFAPDEHLQPKLDLSFDGKRDRWNGYDNQAHQEVIDEFNKLETVKKEVKKERVMADMAAEQLEDDGGASSDDNDEDKYVDKMDMPGTKMDAAERYTVRNLRIREDTAKYLRNLDLSSAHYDPKTRSMRKNPYEGTGKSQDEVDFAGDNFVRITGDTINHAQSQMFSWEAGRKGLEVHALADPTKLEALKKEFVEKKDKLENKAKNDLLDTYGGQEYIDAAPPRELIFAQTENYVEYSRSGKVIKGAEETVVRSKFPEDVYPGNHTSVWGSFWHEGQWGYKCCYSFLKQSYCTGATGRENFQSVLAASTTAKAAAAAAAAPSEDKTESGEDSKSGKKHKKKKKKKDKKKEGDGDEEEEDFETQVKKAMKKLEKEEKEAEASKDDRKRSYNSIGSEANNGKGPTDAEMEAYYRKRQRADDPMAKYL